MQQPEDDPGEEEHPEPRLEDQAAKQGAHKEPGRDQEDAAAAVHGTLGETALEVPRHPYPSQAFLPVAVPIAQENRGGV